MQDTARIARKLAALASLGLERVEAPPAVATEAFPIGRDGWKVICTRPAMGTIVSLTGIAGSQAAVEEAVGRAFAEMDRLIGFMSRYEPSSAVSHLNTAGILDDAPAEVARVVETSLQYHELTGGAFDITVAPLLELFRSRLDAAVPAEPSDAEIREALALVGARHVGVAHRSIRFARAGMTVTLDGIAKGHIVDAMARTLERHGVKRYLVNAGGDIRARGTKEGRRPWTVAVLDPRTPG